MGNHREPKFVFTKKQKEQEEEEEQKLLIRECFFFQI
jgi:hypothetical protein